MSASNNINEFGKTFQGIRINCSGNFHKEERKTQGKTTPPIKNEGQKKKR